MRRFKTEGPGDKFAGAFFLAASLPRTPARLCDAMTTSRHTRRAFAPLLPLLLLLCAAAQPARAQRAYKIDETEYTRCDLSEVSQVTDLPMPVFVELERHPKARAAVVVYGPSAG